MPIRLLLAALMMVAFAAACGGDDATPTKSATVAPTASTTPTGNPNGVPTVSANAVTTATGLRYEDTQAGPGASPNAGDCLEMHYTGWLQDGTEFDSSRGGDPFHFELGARRVIAGWDEGVASMKVGGQRILVIPPALGYGADGSPPVIPGNALLVFEVELVAIVDAAACNS